MSVIYAYIDFSNHPDVGEYAIHGVSGSGSRHSFNKDNKLHKFSWGLLPSLDFGACKVRAIMIVVAAEPLSQSCSESAMGPVTGLPIRIDIHTVP